MERLQQYIHQLFTYLGIEESFFTWGQSIIFIIGIFIIAYLTSKIFQHAVIPAIHKITIRTKTTWDDYLFNKRVMKCFRRLIPPIVWYLFLPLVFPDTPNVLSILLKVCYVYLIIVILMLINAFFHSLYEISNEHEKLKNRPLKGIYQMMNLIAIGIGGILIISTLLNKDATSILAGLGASAAVLMLIFRDSILGLVAGIQLSANDMLRPGDWITMPKHGANGFVTEVSLTTVKVRNFDQTITTIPPYILVSDSFQNWRGMWEIKGRRIKRSINIDMTTIHFCTEEEKKRLRSKGWIDEQVDTEELVNLYAFRYYTTLYLKANANINQDLMLMVRQMQPTSEGLPIEIYCFTHTTEWLPYEKIQGEIFDHLLAILPEFGLQIFQRPAGSDLNGHAFSQDGAGLPGKTA